MKVLTVLGARPEFIQWAPVTRALRRRHQEVVVHTGQHFDPNMSDVFFQELDLPAPDHHLGVHGGAHGEQTGRMLIELEKVMQREAPDWVVLFGDTNSTLAAALCAAKQQRPVAHIEAGLRSYDRAMPEEVNRVLVDHVSTLLLCPTERAVSQLAAEGITLGVHLVGDVRVDLVPQVLKLARSKIGRLRKEAGIGESEPFVFSTIHRASNTDSSERLEKVLGALAQVPLPVVLPVHPRLKCRMKDFRLKFPGSVRAIDPVSFLETTALLDASKYVVTDSGGLQKEAYLLSKQTITLRDTTEWAETITAGYNRLTEPDSEPFLAALTAAERVVSRHPDLYGSPGVCERIALLLEQRP